MKWFKYLLPLLINSVVLTILLLLWTDQVEQVFDPLIRYFELLKIFGITVLSLIATRLWLTYLNRKNCSANFKLKVISGTILLISSLMYVSYTQKIVHHFKHREIRRELAGKIIPVNQFNNGSEANGLVIEEYQQIVETSHFPEIPIQAKNICYLLYSDGFLPDYTFKLTYDLPENAIVETLHFREGDFSKIQKVEIHKNFKRVIYEEGIQ